MLQRGVRGCCSGAREVGATLAVTVPPLPRHNECSIPVSSWPSIIRNFTRGARYLDPATTNTVKSALLFPQQNSSPRLHSHHTTTVLHVLKHSTPLSEDSGKPSLSCKLALNLHGPHSSGPHQVLLSPAAPSYTVTCAVPGPDLIPVKRTVVLDRDDSGCSTLANDEVTCLATMGSLWEFASRRNPIANPQAETLTACLMIRRFELTTMFPLCVLGFLRIRIHATRQCGALLAVHSPAASPSCRHCAPAKFSNFFSRVGELRLDLPPTVKEERAERGVGTVPRYKVCSRPIGSDCSSRSRNAIAL